MATSPAEAQARKEQRREKTKARLRAAVVELAPTTSFNDMRVEEIAATADLSRSAFYFYYRDKRDVLIDATSEAFETLYEQSQQWWLGSGEPRASSVVRWGLHPDPACHPGTEHSQCE